MNPKQVYLDNRPIPGGYAATTLEAITVANAAGAGIDPARPSSAMECFAEGPRGWYVTRRPLRVSP